MISLDKYPRPPQDTRICFHGTANQYNPWGPDIRYWLGEVKAMGGTWVKGLSDRDGNTGVEWAREALGLGLMPVVRIYQSMPYLLDDTIKKAIDRLVAAGVRYIETLNEPDNQQEWNPVPPNWADIAAQNMIGVARYIQAAGGIPLMPSLSTGSPGSYQDLTAKIKQWGGADIFEKLFAMSIHNYPLNHPIGLDAWGQSDTYPLDSVNRAGTPVSPELYVQVGAFGWEGRTLAWVNAKRIEKKNPGADMFSDNCGEVNLFYVEEMAKRTLGFYPLCLVTEGGVIIGDAQDERYPKNGPEYMRDANLELARRCMGTSTEHGGKHNYPPHVAAGAGYWLIHNYGGPPNWNSQAWYGTTWPPNFRNGDHLWIVDALRAEPKRAYNAGAPVPIPVPEPIPVPVPVPVPPISSVPVGWTIPADLPRVAFMGAGAAVGATYFKLVKAEWFPSDPPNVFVDVLGLDGKRKPGVLVAFSWRDGEASGGVPVDKPIDFRLQGVLGSYNIQVVGPSDRVTGLGLGTIAQPDYTIHTHFNLTFQEAVAVGVPEPPAPVDDMVLLVPSLPESRVIDLRGRLPVRVVGENPEAYATRSWPDSQVIGVGAHWADASGRDWTAKEIATYQTGPFVDPSQPKFPEIAYHLQIAQDGRIYWLLPLEKIPWHVGSDLNRKWLGVLIQPPLGGAMTEAQVMAARKLLSWLSYGMGRQLELKGHSELGTTACPGPKWADNKRRILGEEETPAEPPVIPPVDDTVERLAKAKGLAQQAEGLLVEIGKV